MELMNLINEIASLVLFLNATAFYVFLFGKENAHIDKLPKLEYFLLKIGLILIAAGGLYNTLIMSYPPTIEIIMNIGYAAVFTWAAIFHYRNFVKK